MIGFMKLLHIYKVIEMFNGKAPIDLGDEETFWLQVERWREEYDEYAYFEYEVPVDWLSEHVNDIEEFIEEYMSDETTGLYDEAVLDGVIINEQWVED